MLAFSQNRCPLRVRPRGGTFRCQGTTKSTWHKQKSRCAERVMFFAHILDLLRIVIYTFAGALQPSAGLDRTHAGADRSMAPHAHPWSAGTKSAGGEVAWTLTSLPSWVPVPKARLVNNGYLVGTDWKCCKRVSWLRSNLQAVRQKLRKGSVRTTNPTSAPPNRRMSPTPAPSPPSAQSCIFEISAGARAGAVFS